MRSVVDQLLDAGEAIRGLCRTLGQLSCCHTQQQSSQQRAQSPPDAG